MIKKMICLLLAAVMVLGLCACGGQGQDDIASAETSPAADTPSPETTETPQPTEEPLSETTLAEMEIFDAIDYGRDNFITEAEFYDILTRVLALHDLELTRYPGDNAYYYLNYSNVGSVKLLTMAKTMEEIEADQEEAQAAYEAEAAEYQKQQEAAANGETYEAPEETEAPAEEEEEFDAAKDVESSQDYVVSFVLSATDSEADQQLMFLISAAVWCIMNPHYNNTDDAFTYLWRGLYTIYAQSEGLSASTIDGFDTDLSFTIPGNAAEAWLGTDDNGNYVLAITMYAVYDELIDIAGTSGSSFQSAVPSIGG